MQIVLFEDKRAAQLAPVAIARPAYAVHCGSYRLVDLVARLGTVCGIVRQHLCAIEAASYPDHAPPSAGPLAGPVLLVNARLVPSVAMLAKLKELAEAGREGAAFAGDSIAAALLNRNEIMLPAGDDRDSAVDSWLQTLELPPLAVELRLIDYPHDLLREHLAVLGENLDDRLKQQSYRQLNDGVFVADDVSLGDYLVTDTRSGPILIDRGTSIAPFCFLRGPCYLGPDSRLIEHAALKDGVSLGHTTKVGGEVEAAIVEPYTNKQHHGFLGHSYLGSWVNLGAGTSNSDLKNTYGTVKMEYRGQRVATNMQFVGCFIGDYSKTAINTGIFTGKTIGVCSMVYGFVTTNVPSFCNYARLFGQVTELPPEVMIATQQRMFARRNFQQRPCDIQLIHDLYELTRHERQLAGEPLTL